MEHSFRFGIYNPFTDETETVDITTDLSFDAGGLFDSNVCSIVSNTGVELLNELSDDAIALININVYRYCKELNIQRDIYED